MRKLTEDVAYIGCDDTAIDLFESQYIVPQGISYNSYVILDEKVAIMDTSDPRKGNEWNENLRTALNGRIPDFLIVQHMEPDHSSMIAATMKEYPMVKVVASQKAIQMMSQFFEGIKTEDRCIAVNDRDRLSLGTHTLQFITAPMVHWPEVIVTYDEKDGALYSADGFGKFGALGKCGFYGSDDGDWSCEARRYYFNIVGKYGASVQALIKKIGGLQIRSIRPLHGPILEDDLGNYLSLYDTWSSYRAETDGIFIACASIHGGTMEAAEHLADMLRTMGEQRVVISDLCRSDIAENVEDAFRHSRMILACSTYDGGMFSPMHDFLYRLSVKGYCNRKVGIVENGTWAPMAAKAIKAMLESMKGIEVAEPTVTIRSRRHEGDEISFRALAEAMVKS